MDGFLGCLIVGIVITIIGSIVGAIPMILLGLLAFWGGPVGIFLAIVILIFVILYKLGRS